MNLETGRHSAKIYRFPLGGRRDGSAKIRDVAPETAGKAGGTAAVGGAWYHDAAIQEERPRKA